MSTKCSNCRKQLDDLFNLPSGDRATCPNCGSKIRDFFDNIKEDLSASDHISALQERGERKIGFSESPRADCRACFADCDNGSLSYGISGSTPQGEEVTLEVCRLLIQKLNSEGRNWDDPVSGNGVVDCEALDLIDPQKHLQIQVVRANTEKSFWEELNTNGAVQRSDADPSVRIEESIKKKEKIRLSDRKGLTLALDATLLPGFAFDDVIREFRKRYSAQAVALGFDEIWLVGPIDKLIQKVD